LSTDLKNLFRLRWVKDFFKSNFLINSLISILKFFPQDLTSDSFIKNESETKCRSFGKIRPYECGFCKKRFTRQDLLQNHVRIHTGEKPYKCDPCGERFTEAGTLRRHSREEHNDVKRFECQICNMRFSRNDNLKQHEKIHSTVRSYECKICKKTFVQACSLTIHKSVHK
jgi:uncharacterized Zn-finger protein